MIAQCSTCSRTFEVENTGAQYCPHCGTHVYIEVPETGQQGGQGPNEPPRWEAGGAPPSGSSPPYGGAPPPGSHPPYGSPPGAPPPGGGGDRSPFERRDELGFFGGFFQTVKMALFDPRALFQNMRVDNSDGAFLFGWLCLTIGSLATNFWNFVSNSFTGSPLDPEDLAGLPPELAGFLEQIASGTTGPGQFLLAIILTPISAAIGVFVWAGIVHVGTLIFGANNRGWNANFRAVCYGSAPMLAGILPFCGGMIGSIWAMVLTIVGVVFLQRTTPARASLSVLVWIFLCCICACVGVFAGMAAMASAFGS